MKTKTRNHLVVGRNSASYNDKHPENPISLLMHDGDYVLDPRARTCWITVDDISVHIVRLNGEVAVSLYPLHDEMNDPIDVATSGIKELV